LLLAFAIIFPLFFPHTKLKSLQGPEQDSVPLRKEEGTKEDFFFIPSTQVGYPSSPSFVQMFVKR